MRTYFETADVARGAKVTPGAVRKWVDAGVLTAAARTQRGVRLFDPDDAERVIERRREALKAGRRGPSIMQ
jgi:DNA-binding transcriptional MerR regulator